MSQSACSKCGRDRCWHQGRKPPHDPYRFTGVYMGWWWKNGEPTQKAPSVGI